MTLIQISLRGGTTKNPSNPIPNLIIVNQTFPPIDSSTTTTTSHHHKHNSTYPPSLNHVPLPPNNLPPPPNHHLRPKIRHRSPFRRKQQLRALHQKLRSSRHPSRSNRDIRWLQRRRASREHACMCLLPSTAHPVKPKPTSTSAEKKTSKRLISGDWLVV